MSGVLAMRGIRGGVGTTTLLAGIGDALHRMGERVLLVDACPENMLGLHFNMPVDEAAGWAQADLQGADWRSAAFAVQEGLVVLPYGQVPGDGPEILESRLRDHAGLWQERIHELSGRFDWVLFDLPQRLPAHVAALMGDAPNVIPLCVLNPDPACHVLLQRRRPAPERTFFLANGFDPSVQLQRDLVQLWSTRLGRKWLSRTVHEDAAVPEALAMKSPIGRYRPESLASADFESLAIWCLAEAGRGGRG